MLKTKKKTALESKQPKLISVSSLFFPLLAIGLIAVLGAGINAFQQSFEKKDAGSDELIKAAGTFLSAQIQSITQAKIDQLNAILAGRQFDFKRIDERKLAKLEYWLKKTVSSAIEIRIIPVDRWDESLVQKKLFNSYAATEMYQQVLKTGRPAPVEALKISNRIDYIVAIPIKKNHQVIAVLEALFPFSTIQSYLKPVQIRSAAIKLKQQGELVLLSFGQGLGMEQAGPRVPGTLWQMYYTINEYGGMPWLNLASLIFLINLAAFAVLFWVYRSLIRRINKDQQRMMHLLSLIGTDKGSKSENAQLKENQALIKKLTELAQSQVLKEVKEKRIESKAGQFQTDVSQLKEEETSSMLLIDTEQLPEHWFKAGVIRWYRESRPNEEAIQALGLAIGTLMQKEGHPTVLMGRDHITSSQEIADQLCSGILASGCNVVDLGSVPMPHLSFATYMTAVKSAIMVSGGHNAPLMQGIKLILNNQYLSQDKTVQLRHMITEGHCLKGRGQLSQKDLSGEYIAAISNEIELVDSYKIVLDCGHGIAGELAQRVFNALDCEVIPLYCQPDEHFPNHPPHPGLPFHLKDLSDAVLENGADIGIALDNDGDALAVVDEKGKPLPNDILLLILSNDIIRRNPGSDVIYDMACSTILPKHILSNGGRPILTKSGASSIQAQLLAGSALIAGEFSGHIYIQERWNGFDDGIYAAARLLEILSLEGLSLSEARQFDPPLLSSPRLEMEIPDGHAESMIEFLKHHLNQGTDIDETDGLKIEYPDAWALVRPSNVASQLIFRFEGKSEQSLQKIEEQFRQAFQQFSPQIELPF